MCRDAALEKQRAWKMHRRFSSAENKALHKVAANAAADFLYPAKVGGIAAIRRRLKHSSLMDNQWWSSVKKADGDRLQATIQALKDDVGCDFITSKEIANQFGQCFSRKHSLGDWDLESADPPPFPARCKSVLSRIRFGPNTMERHLRQVDASKAIDLDGLSSCALKECAASSGGSLAVMFGKKMEPLTLSFTKTFLK